MEIFTIKKIGQNCPRAKFSWRVTCDQQLPCKFRCIRIRSLPVNNSNHLKPTKK